MDALRRGTWGAMSACECSEQAIKAQGVGLESPLGFPAQATRCGGYRVDRPRPQPVRITSGLVVCAGS